MNLVFFSLKSIFFSFAFIKGKDGKGLSYFWRLLNSHFAL
jgi:hypothetical protein